LIGGLDWRHFSGDWQKKLGRGLIVVFLFVLWAFLRVVLENVHVL
jgi:hypothetical protein